MADRCKIDRVSFFLYLPKTKNKLNGLLISMQLN